MDRKISGVLARFRISEADMGPLKVVTIDDGGNEDLAPAEELLDFVEQGGHEYYI